MPSKDALCAFPANQPARRQFPLKLPFWVAAAIALAFSSGTGVSQTNNYFGTAGTISGTVWSTNPSGPYTSALVTTGGAILNFNNATTTVAGATITAVAGINATANVTFTSVNGTIG